MISFLPLAKIMLKIKDVEETALHLIEKAGIATNPLLPEVKETKARHPVVKPDHHNLVIREAIIREKKDFL